MRGRVNGSNFMPDVSSPTWLHLRADHKRVSTNTRTASWRSEEDEASSRRFSIDHAIRMRRGCVIQARFRENPMSIHRSSRWHPDRARVACLVCHVKRPFFFRNAGTLPGTSLTGSPALELTRHTNPQRLNTYAAFHRRHFHEHMAENLSTYSRALVARFLKSQEDQDPLRSNCKFATRSLQLYNGKTILSIS